MAATAGGASDFLFYCIVFISITLVTCWDTEDFEVFDVVEEVNQNFYELLGLEKTATSAEIRRAYRKLSLQLHPDRNKQDNAEEKFRQLVSVYEILKDEDKRKRYNQVLENGLPDWRQPVFYYRRVRKMGLLELAILLFIILTGGQYIVVWSIYFERKFELEEVFKPSKKKKDKKNRRAKQNPDDEDEELKETLSALPKPKLTDLIPCLIVRVLYHVVKSLPVWVMEFKIHLRNRLSKPEEKEEDTDDEDEDAQKKRRRRRVETPDAGYVPEMAEPSRPVVYTMTSDPEPTDEQISVKKEGEWSTEDLSLLAKACNKFPGGTPQRWEKIAVFVGRSVAEVTSKSKQLRTSYAVSVDASAQGTVGTDEKKVFKKGKEISDRIISTREENMTASANNTDSKTKSTTKKSVDRTKKLTEEAALSTAHNVGNKIHSYPATNTSVNTECYKSDINPASAKLVGKGDCSDLASVSNDSEAWTQNQQKILEWALTVHVKGTKDRWDKIAEQIPGKTKEDCIERFKHLADMVRRRKQATQQKSQ